MFQNLKLSDLLVVIVIIAVVGVSGYYYANPVARTTLWLDTYPARAELSARHISCSEDSPAWLADIISYQVRHNNAPANQIAYIEPNGTLHHCENGYEDKYPLLSASTTEQTRFRYASVTKLWTADSILELIKADKLSLDTKLSSLLPEIDAPTDARINEITIGQLLLHRAGFDRTSVFGNDMFNIGEQICPDNLQGLNDITLGFDPDSTTSYSNLGYCLLGEVISRLNDNIPYTKVIAKQYGFSDTQLKFVPNAPMADEVYYNYVETGAVGIADIYTAFDYEALASSAGLSGNVIDIAKQARLMAAKPTPNILSLNADIDCDMSQLRDCYGYVMFPYQPNTQSATIYYRDGSLLGLSSLVAIEEHGGVVALLSNGLPETRMQGSDKVKMMIYQHLTAAP